MADLSAANAYFSERLNTTAWDSADDATKTKALVQAERELEPYKDRADTTRLTYAIYEQALWLLQDDPRGKLQQGGVTSVSIGRTSETFKLRHDPGIAPKAWDYLQGPAVKVGGLR